MHPRSTGPVLVEQLRRRAEYYDDLLKVTGGKTDETARAPGHPDSSEECLPWMEEHGVRFQPSLSGTLSLARTNAFFLGGGKSAGECLLPHRRKRSVSRCSTKLQRHSSGA